MVRLTELDDVLFPVEVRPIYVRLGDGDGARMQPISQKRAIVRSDTGRVLGVVKDQYRLVSNRQALDWGRECCQMVFPGTQASEWEVTATDAPGSAGHCMIDFAHNSTKLDFEFIDAMTDQTHLVLSFASLIATKLSEHYDLTSDFRKVCKNGLIIQDTIVRFHFVHSRKAIGEKIKFDVAQQRLAEFNNSFRESMRVLREYSVPSSMFSPLTLAALLIRKPNEENGDADRSRAWSEIKFLVSALSLKYASQLGMNAYAVFNVITEFASRPLANSCMQRERHSLQRLAGKWLSEFSGRCREPSFSLAEYVKSLNAADDNVVSGDPNSTVHSRH